MQRFFEVKDHITFRNRWYLKGPVADGGGEVDPRLFTAAQPVDVVGRLFVPVRQAGVVLDFTFADFGMPVVRKAVAQTVARLAPDEVQTIPVDVEGTADEFLILNALRSENCIDDENSDVMRWSPSDGRPDKVGEYRMVLNLRIEPGRTRGASIFRLKGWETSLVVAEPLKIALAQATGIRFTQV